MDSRKTMLAMAVGMAFGGMGARQDSYTLTREPDGLKPPPRKKGRKISDIPYGPPRHPETRQQRRHRERMEAKDARRKPTKESSKLGRFQ